MGDNIVMTWAFSWAMLSYLITSGSLVINIVCVIVYNDVITAIKALSGKVISRLS
jgi:hypothetical protein